MKLYPLITISVVVINLLQSIRANLTDDQVALLRSCEFGEVEQVYSLLTSMSAIEIQGAINEHKESALMLACRNGHFDIANMVVNSTGDLVTYRHPISKQTPLFYAASSPVIQQSEDKTFATKFLETLLNAGSDVEHRDAQGRTAFLEAIRTSSINFAEALRKQNANVSVSDNRGFNVWHLAQDRPTFEYLAWVPVNYKLLGFPAQSHEGLTPLHIAILEKKDMDVISFIYKNVAKPAKVDSKARNMLHMAVEVDFVDALKYFAMVADVDAAKAYRVRENSTQHTPLGLAITLRRIEAAIAIIKSPLVSIEELNQELMPGLINNTYLHEAISAGLEKVALALAEKSKGLVAIPNRLKQIPLHLAITREQTELIRTMSSDLPTEIVKLQDQNKRTAFHLLALKCRAINDAIPLLAPFYGDSAKVLDAQGENAFETAIRHNCINLAKSLLNNGASCSKLNERTGNSPLHLAKLLAFDEMIEALLSTNKCSLDQKNAADKTVSQLDIFADSPYALFKQRIEGLETAIAQLISNSKFEALKSKVEDTLATVNDLKQQSCNEFTDEASQIKSTLAFCHNSKIDHPRDCEDIALSKGATSGIYKVKPHKLGQEIDVYCDMDHFGGGWTVIQRRINGTRIFARNWSAYKTGFGDKAGEFWLGNDAINQLTSDDFYQLLIGVYASASGWAVYDNFQIGDEKSNYKLHYEKRACANGIAEVSDEFSLRKESTFSTSDSSRNSGVKRCDHQKKSGWWFYDCKQSDLNGAYWYDGYQLQQLQSSFMMIRKKKMYNC